MWLVLEAVRTTDHIRPGGELLRDMRQLVREQSSSLTRVRFELARTKHQVVSYRVGTRIHIPRRLLGSRAGMHAHPRKVEAKAPFHFPLYRRVERLACAGQGVVHTGRGDSGFIDRLRDNALDTRCAADGRGLRRS
jgi:hypothetical protein